MARSNFDVRLPMAHHGNTRLAVFVGEVTTDLGTRVKIRDLTTMESWADMYLRDIICEPIQDISESLLVALGYNSTKALVDAVGASVRVGIPPTAKISIFVMSDPDTEIDWLYEELAPPTEEDGEFEVPDLDEVDAYDDPEDYGDVEEDDEDWEPHF